MTCWRCSPDTEGMLGVTTEVTVKLLPKPPVARVLLASFDSVKSQTAVGDIIANGIIPGRLEMMDNLSIRAAEEFIHAGYPSTPKQFCYASWTACESDVQEDCERVNDILLKAGATDVRLAQDEAERAYVSGRSQNPFPAVAYLPGLLLHGSHRPPSRPAWRTGRHCPFIAAI
ncbi:FAD-linked oxidase C-terminal domain-containing protein [Shigella flexneri]